MRTMQRRNYRTRYNTLEHRFEIIHATIPSTTSRTAIARIPLYHGADTSGGIHLSYFPLRQ